MSFISEKSKGTPKSIIREFVGMSYKFDNVLSFGFGQPDFVTPKHILDAAVASLQRGETFYAPNTGILPLREAISECYRERGLSYSPDELLIGSGAISVLLLAVTATLDIGDEQRTTRLQIALGPPLQGRAEQLGARHAARHQQNLQVVFQGIGLVELIAQRPPPQTLTHLQRLSPERHKTEQ